LKFDLVVTNIPKPSHKWLKSHVVADGVVTFWLISTSHKQDILDSNDLKREGFWDYATTKEKVGFKAFELLKH
jgi:hypothetical protein